MITHATISHFKSISECTLNFGPMNVVVGPNGVGKSNVIDALYFVRDCLVEDLDTAITKRHGIESIRQWSKTRPYHLSIELGVRNRSGFGTYKLTLASASGNYRVVEESGEWWGDNPFKSNEPDPEKRVKLSSFTRKENGEVDFASDVEQAKRETERTIKIHPYDLYATRVDGSSHFSLFELLLRPLVSEISSFVTYAIYPNTLRQPQVVSRRDELLQDGSNLATILKKINNGNRPNKDAVLESLRVVMPLATDFRVISAGGYYVPTIRVVEPSGDQHDFNMSQISDGTLRVLGILAAFYQVSAPNIIALEEPEQMIHPGALPIIVEAAKEYISKGGGYRQVFMTTHSPQLLDLVPPESIIGATFEGGITLYSPIAERHMDLIKSQLFSAGEILVAEGFHS